MLFKLKITVILVLIQLQATAEVKPDAMDKKVLKKLANDTGEPSSLECDKEFLVSMGVIGLEQSKKLELEMCPTIRQSCCSIEDQINIYEFWIQGGEKKNLDERLAYHREVYYDLIKVVAEIYDRAKQMEKLLENKPTSNCKVLARRINHFQVDKVIPLIKKSIDDMLDFFKTSYQGLYCGICDAYNLPYIDVENQLVFLSKKFCRTVTGKTLNPMLYFHVHFPKFLNIGTRFITSCNVKGEYKEKLITHKNLFSVSKRSFDTLNDCKRDRNNKNWFDSCESLCKKYNLGKFPTFYQPHLNKYQKYTLHMEILLEKRRKEAEEMEYGSELEGKKKKKAETPEQKKKRLRLEKYLKEKRLREIKEKSFRFGTLDLYESVKNSMYGIDKFKVVFKNMGMGMYDLGNETEITDTTWTNVKEQLKKGDKGGVTLDNGKGAKPDAPKEDKPKETTEIKNDSPATNKPNSSTLLPLNLFVLAVSIILTGFV